MKQSNKQDLQLRRKPLRGQINRQPKFLARFSENTLSSEIKTLKPRIKQSQSFLNVSLIEASSFISNKQDGSLDSMEKMMIGVPPTGVDLRQFEQEEEQSKGSVNDQDFVQIHKQYERLIGRNELLGEEDEEEVEESAGESSRVLLDEEDWQLKELGHIEKRYLMSISPRKKQATQNEIKLHLQKIQSKLDQMKVKKIQDSSNNSIKILVGNLGNLSQIHQERENYLNNSEDQQRKRNNEDDEQDFIDFVRQPDPQQNIESIQKKNQFSSQNLLEHLELELEKQKDIKKVQNYQQILEALNSKQEDEAREEQGEGLAILAKRQQWIRNRKQKSEQWRKTELQLVSKMRKIMKNPHYDSDDSLPQ